METKTSKHTPTPWRTNSSEQIYDAKGNVIVGASYGINRKYDTPFIVLAVNSYERDQEVIKGLVEAANQALAYLQEPKGHDAAVLRGELPRLPVLLREVIAKAEGR